MIAAHSTYASFNVNFNVPPGQAPEIVGTNTRADIGLSFSLAYERGAWTGGLNFVYEVSYRVFLQPTGNPDVVIVGMEWSTRALFWERNGKVYLWAINKNAPQTPLAVNQNGEVTAASTQATTAPSTNGDTPNQYDDDNQNGWEDGIDAAWQAYLDDAPEGHVTIGEMIIIDSDAYDDTDEYFDEDAEVLETISIEIET